MSQKTSGLFKVSGEKPVPQEPSFAMREYMASNGTVIDRFQSGRVGSRDRVRRLLHLKDQLDALEKEIATSGN